MFPSSLFFCLTFFCLVAETMIKAEISNIEFRLQLGDLRFGAGAGVNFTPANPG
jgi:hypothetical protein